MFDMEACVVQVCCNPDKNEWARGFITQGAYIITAAHCLPRLPTPDPFNSEPVLVQICGVRFTSDTGSAEVVFVDPCQDIAILGKSDNGARPGTQFPAALWPDDAQTLPRLLLGDKLLCGDTPVLIYTHLNTWLSGRVFIDSRTVPRCEVVLDDREARILPGTSGSPVFTKEGHILGIVTNKCEDRPAAMVTIAALALPVWATNEETDMQQLADDDC